MARSDEVSKPRRPYRSPSRVERGRRTRGAILAAAHDLFVAHGYAATSIRAVAVAAGVSVPTVEQAFGTKRTLLKTVVDVAKAGDDEPGPLLDRTPARAARTASTTAEFLRLASAEIGTVAARTGPIHAVLAAAAAGDPEIAVLARETDHQRRIVATWLVDGLRARVPLRPDLDPTRVVDIVWTLLDPAVHRRLTVDCGWSAEDYPAWLADSLARLLLQPPDNTG